MTHQTIKRAAWPSVLLLVFTASAFSSMTRKSATWDETHYLGVGLYLFEHLRWDIPAALVHPPGSYYLNSLPLLLADLDRSCFEEGESWRIVWSGVRRGQCLLGNSDPSGDALLLLARLPTLGLGIVLGCFVYAWASRIFGRGGALLALFLYSLSPNVLAHTRLLTPDVMLAAFGFIAVYYSWSDTRRPAPASLGLCGLSLGLCLLTKYAALLWIPILAAPALLATVADPSRPFRLRTDRFDRRPLVRFGAALAIALLVLAAGYGFHLQNYLDGIGMQGRMVDQGRPAFLSGNVSLAGGWYHYYLVALLIKVPIPGLALVLAAFVLCRRFPGFGWFDAASLLFPAVAILVAFSALSEVNLGLRYVLPAFPFVMVFSAGLATLWQRSKRVRGLALISLLAWYAYESLAIHPDYLAYFNQLVGGPDNGHRHLVDSNLDWGQDLKGLKAYMDRRGIDEIALSYFGTADPAQYGIRYSALPSCVLLDPPPATPRLERGDVLAVSATNLHRLYVDLGELGNYLGTLRPIDRIGHSIHIYEIEQPPELNGILGRDPIHGILRGTAPETAR